MADNRKYANVSLTSGDIKKNESHTHFTNCEMSGAFDGVNFSFSKFENCTYKNASFRSCNFAGCENPPDAGLLSSCNTGKPAITRDQAIARWQEKKDKDYA